MARVKEMTARLVSFLIASKCPRVSIAQACRFGSLRSEVPYRNRAFTVIQSRIAMARLLR